MEGLFKQDVGIFKKVRNVLLAFMFILAWSYTVDGVIEKVTGEVVGNGARPTPYYLLFVCLLGPLVEEATYRYAPIEIAKERGIKKLLPIIVLSSIVFGLAHGYGMISILMQGVMGFVFSIVYIRNGDSFLSSFATHSLWNFSLLFL